MVRDTLDRLAIDIITTSGMTYADIKISLPLACIEDLHREILSNITSSINLDWLSCDFKKVKSPIIYVYQSIGGIKFYITPLFHDVDDIELDSELDRMEKESLHYE